MIDLTRIPNRMCYPPPLPLPKTAYVFQMGSSYIVYSVYRQKVLERKWTKFGLKKAIKKLEKQGWIVEKDR